VHTLTGLWKLKRQRLRWQDRSRAWRAASPLTLARTIADSGNGVLSIRKRASCNDAADEWIERRNPQVRHVERYRESSASDVSGGWPPSESKS
jgi:hypothetical protein